MKKITLHRATTDNMGLFCDGGAELTVGDAIAANTITLKRAKDLVAKHGAVAAADDGKA